MPLPTKPAKRELANRYSQFSALFADLGEELEKQLANNPSDKAIPHTYNGMRYESFSYGKVRRLLKRSPTGRLGPQQESVRGWLNDDIINAYLNLLCQDVKDFGYDQRAACIDSIAMSCLADGKCIDGALRQSNVDGRRFFSKEMIFMPYLRNRNHWVLIVVFPQSKKIVHLDTLGSANLGIVQNVRRLIKEQHPGPAAQSDWPCYNLLDDIQSPNIVACGDFVLSLASSYIYGFMDTDDLPDDLVLRAGHMPYTILDLKHRPDVEREFERTFGNKRLRVAAELLTGKISSHTWGMRRATRGPKGMLAEIVDLTLDGDSPEAEEPTKLGDNFSSIDSTAYSDDEEGEEEKQVIPTLEAGIGANGVRADKTIMFWQICQNSSADELLEYVKKNPGRFPGFETKFGMTTMIWGQDLERWAILELQACEGMDDAWVLANRVVI